MPSDSHAPPSVYLSAGEPPVSAAAHAQTVPSEAQGVWYKENFRLRESKRRKKAASVGAAQQPVIRQAPIVPVQRAFILPDTQEKTDAPAGDGEIKLNGGYAHWWDDGDPARGKQRARERSGNWRGYFTR
jgi:hypothetical protein